MRHSHCIVINLRSAVTLIMVFILSVIRQSHSVNGIIGLKTVNQLNNASNNTNDGTFFIAKNLNESKTDELCVSDDKIECSTLLFPCIRCIYNYSCHYGRNINTTCNVLDHIKCKGDRTFQRTMNCRYCYQTELRQYKCILRGNCNSANDHHYRTNCTVHSDILCLGTRTFPRNVKCNWTQGYRWSTALLISVTLGGFGADRFYLGHWQEGIGKLFSFGGLGVWTIIDVLLISLHYLGPADGSLYI